MSTGQEVRPPNIFPSSAGLRPPGNPPPAARIAVTALLLSLAALGVALACAVHCARVQGTTDEAECTVRACASDDAPA